MILARTVTVTDPLARANVSAALAGSGGPAGTIDVAVDGVAVTVRFDDERTAPELIEALIAVELAYVPDRAAAPAGRDAAAAAAARGLVEPDLVATRIIETYLP